MFYRIKEEDGSVDAEASNGDDHGNVEDPSTLEAKVLFSQLETVYLYYMLLPLAKCQILIYLNYHSFHSLPLIKLIGSMKS